MLRLYRMDVMTEAEMFSLKIKLRANGFDVDLLASLDRELVRQASVDVFFTLYAFSVSMWR